MPIANIELHLQNIKSYIHKDTLISAEKIVNAHYAAPLFTYNPDYDYKNINIINVINITYTDNNSYYSHFTKTYEIFDLSDSRIIQDVVSVIQYCKNYQINAKLLSPLLKEGYKNAFCDYNTKLLFVPFFDFSFHEQSFFIHEAAHYLMYRIFNNNGSPFFKDADTDQPLDDYDTAVTKVLCNIQGIFNKHCVISPDYIYTYYDTIKELKQSGFISFFNIRRNFQDGYLSLSDENKKKLEDKYEELVRKFNLNSDQVIILERIGEFLDRNNSEYASEFIVRLPELILRIYSLENLEYFEPLCEFWLKHISPAVANFLRAHDCLEHESKEEITNQCFLEEVSLSHGDIIELEHNYY
jgi:hypothetical protein